MAVTLKFRECDACKVKPGTPALCTGCLHNRSQIDFANREIKHLDDLVKSYQRMARE